MLTYGHKNYNLTAQNKLAITVCVLKFLSVSFQVFQSLMIVLSINIDILLHHFSVEEGWGEGNS